MKKTIIIAAAAALAALVGCTKQEPTELKSENMPNKSMVYGYVQSMTRKSDGNYTSKEIEPKVTVFLTIDGKETIEVTTNQDGFFKTEIGMGGSSVTVKAEVYIKDRDSFVKKESKWVKSTVDLYGSKTATLAPHNSVNVSIIAVPVAAYGDIGEEGAQL